MAPVIYTSPYAPVPSWATTGVFEFLFSNNPKIDPSKAALIDAETGATVTYAQLVTDSLRFASGFTQVAGLKAGDTALIFSGNSILYPSLLFGGQAAGITMSTANASYTGPELAHQLHDSGAKVLLVSSDNLDIAMEAAKVCNFSPNHIYVLPGGDGIVRTKGLKTYELLRGDKAFKPVQIPSLTKSVAYLPYSSGTTSKPKGVALSHMNVTAISLQLNQVKGLFDGPETLISGLPLSHIFGLIVSLHQTLYNGGTIILMPKFDLVQFLTSVQKYKATVALAVPPICLGLAKAPVVDNYDLSSLRFLMSGAAPLSADLQATLEKRLKGKTAVLQGFGMTETTSVALLPDLNDYIPGTCGKLLASIDARLVDADGQDVKTGEPGELWIRGNNNMIGYHKNEKATKETINEDGWLMTGDVCVRSDGGHYTIVDRTKELIKYSGFQVPPAELEAVLLTCPFVADAAVIGVWDESRATELPRAYIVPDAKHAKDSDLIEKIQAFVTSKVAAHKKLRGGVFVLDVIPKSPSGKILRKDLRVLAAKEAAAAKL